MDLIRQLASSAFDLLNPKATYTSIASSPLEESVKDVIRTALLLRQLLPADLVPLILDYAELWPTIATASSLQPDRISEAQSYKFQTAVMIPASIPRGAVRRIRFTTISRDQGWSDYTGDHNTYNGSWTWFEAGVRGLDDSVDHSDTVTSQAHQARTNVFKKCEHHNALHPEHILLCVMKPDSYKYGSKRIVTNLHAGKEFITHVVDWDLDHEDEDVRRMVREVKGGCMVEVAACARFLCWINYVKSVKIEVECAVVRKM